MLSNTNFRPGDKIKGNGEGADTGIVTKVDHYSLIVWWPHIEMSTSYTHKYATACLIKPNIKE